MWKWIALAAVLPLAACEDKAPEPVPGAPASSPDVPQTAAPRMPPQASAPAPLPTSSGPVPAFPAEPARAPAQGPARVTFRFAPRLDAPFEIETVRKKRQIFGGAPRAEEIVRTVVKVTVTRDGEGYRWRESPVAFSVHGQRGSLADEIVAGAEASLRLDAAGKVVSVEGYDDVPARAQALLSPAERKMVGHSLDPAALRRTREQEWRTRIGDLLGQQADVGGSFVTESELPLPRGSEPLYGVVQVGAWTTCPVGKCVVVETRLSTDATSLAAATGIDPDAWHGDADAGAPDPHEGHGHGAKPHVGYVAHSLRIVDPTTSLPVWERAERQIDLGTGKLADEIVIGYRY